MAPVARTETKDAVGGVIPPISDKCSRHDVPRQWRNSEKISGPFSGHDPIRGSGQENFETSRAGSAGRIPEKTITVAASETKSRRNLIRARARVCRLAVCSLSSPVILRHSTLEQNLKERLRRESQDEAVLFSRSTVILDPMSRNRGWVCPERGRENCNSRRTQKLCIRDP